MLKVTWAIIVASPIMSITHIKSKVRFLDLRKTEAELI